MQTDIYYPQGLPNPLREGHALKPVSTFSRTQLASGRARQRLEFENVPVNGVWDFLFDSSQAAVFETWFAYTINNGVDWFNIQRKTPLGMSMLVCRFTDMYSGPALVGRNLWRYSCPLEIEERTLMPPGWELLPGFVIGSDIFDLAMNREWPKNGS